MKYDKKDSPSHPKAKLATKYSEGRTSAKTYVEFNLLWLGKDLIVTISGGVSHIGSLAYSYSAGGRDKCFHQHTHKTHREDVIVKRCIDRLKDLVPGEIIVVGGIHYHDINKNQIADVSRNCIQIIERIASDLLGL